MKRILISFLLTLSVFVSFSQTLPAKLRATSYVTRINGVLSDTQDCNILITLDFERKQIKIHNDSRTVIDVIQSSGETEIFENQRVEVFVSIGEDQEGDLCKVKIIPHPTLGLILALSYEKFNTSALYFVEQIK